MTLLTDLFIDRPVLAALLVQTTAWLLIALLLAAAFRRPSRGHATLIIGGLGALLTLPLVFLARFAGLGMLSPWSAPTNTMLPDGLRAGAPTGAEPLVTIGGIVLITWILVSLVLLARLGAGIVRARRLVRDALPVHDPRLRAAARIAAARLNVPEPRLVCAPGVRSPMIWAWSRPATILVPDPADLPCDRRGLLQIMLHELAHQARRDHLTTLLIALLPCLMPWHPLAWLLARRQRALSELACDRWVLHHSHRACDFARTLLDLIPQPAPSAALAARTSGRGLHRRIHALLDEAATDDPRSGRGWTMTLAAGALCIAALGAAAQPRPLTTTGPEAVARPPLELIDPHWPHAVQVAPVELDLGTVGPGETATGTLWLVNTANHAATVSRIKTTCGCTAVGGFTAGALAAGTVEAVDVTITAPAEPDTAKTKHIIFTIDNQPPLRVPVHVRSGPAPGD